MKKEKQPDASIKHVADKKPRPAEKTRDNTSSAVKKEDSTYKLENDKKESDNNTTIGIP